MSEDSASPLTLSQATADHHEIEPSSPPASPSPSPPPMPPPPPPLPVRSGYTTPTDEQTTTQMQISRPASKSDVSSAASSNPPTPPHIANSIAYIGDGLPLLKRVSSPVPIAQEKLEATVLSSRTVSFGSLGQIASSISPFITSSNIPLRSKREPRNQVLKQRRLIRLGICAMEKKINSKPMMEILNRLRNYQNFEIIMFTEDIILDRSVDEWPKCDAFLCFYSTGFPLSKAEAYVALRKPYQINDITMQRELLDRRRVYQILQDYGIPVPHHVVMNRGTPKVTEENVKELSKELDPESIPKEPETKPEDWSTFEEYEDAVVIDGRRIEKPFVEKPVSGENHNIYIYYPKSAGGGSKRLFRKIENRSSQFYPDISNVRRDRSYIYEEFLSTEGTDIKVYSVGREYSHAEARKSPVVDGRVQRDAEGKEVRYPIMLTTFEKNVALQISLAFKQSICGFDLLRDDSKSYVCDVNGLSFVKNSVKYYDDSARIIRKLLIRRFIKQTDLYRTIMSDQAGGSLPNVPPLMPGASIAEIVANPDGSSSTSTSSSALVSSVPSPKAQPTPFMKVAKKNPEFLRCIIAVIRHGDRTPKQKLKIKMTDPRYLQMFEKFSKSKDANGRPKIRELKLKSAVELQALLDATNEIYDDLAEKRKARGIPTPVFVTTPITEHKPNPFEPKKEANSFVIDATSPTSTPSTTNSIPVDTVLDEQQQLKRSKEEAEEEEYFDKIIQIKQVLERKSHKLKGDGKFGTQFSGINRKAQLKPTKTRKVVVMSEPTEGEEPKVVEQYEVVDQALFVLKWGGELTHAGQKQAEALGTTFRQTMYSDAFHGLVRLHSANRHDLKIYASDEGRVQMTAAAFSRGFLNLEGELTPILVSIVRKDQSANELLDVTGETDGRITETKQRLLNIMSSDNVMEEGYIKELMNTPAKNYPPIRMLKELGNPRRSLMRLYDTIKSITAQLKIMVQNTESALLTGKPPPHTLCEQETIHLMFARWQKLESDFFCKRKNEYNISKIPDIFDCIKYDALHNFKLGLKNIRELYNQAKALNDIVVPQEYGMTAQEKVEIGSVMCQLLLNKIQGDLISSLTDPVSTVPVPGETYTSKLSNIMNRSSGPSGESGEEFVRTRLYFTSESHLHSLLNVLRYASDIFPDAPPIISSRLADRFREQFEIDYLTHIVFRLYENPSRPLDDPARFRLEISMSPGANQSPWEVERRGMSKKAAAATTTSAPTTTTTPAPSSTVTLTSPNATSSSIPISGKATPTTNTNTNTNTIGGGSLGASSAPLSTSNSPSTPSGFKSDRFSRRAQHRSRDMSERKADGESGTSPSSFKMDLLHIPTQSSTANTVQSASTSAPTTSSTATIASSSSSSSSTPASAAAQPHVHHHVHAPEENHAAQLQRRSYLNPNIPLQHFLDGLKDVTIMQPQPK